MRRRRCSPVALITTAMLTATLSTVLPLAGTVSAAASSGSIRVGEFAEAIAISPDGTRAYVTSTDPNTVAVIDTAANIVIATFRTATYPNAIAVSPDGSRLHITALGAHVLQTLDADDGQEVARVPIGAAPTALVLSPDGTRAYVSDANDENVTVVDTAANMVVRRIALNRMSEAIAISPDGTRVYALLTDAPSGIAVIDTADLRITRRIPLGDYSTDIITSADGRSVYVTGSDAESGAGSLTVLDAGSARITRRIPLGWYPGPVGLAADGRHVIVASQGGNILGQRSVASNALVNTVDPATGRVIGSREATGPGSRGTSLADLAANPRGAWTYGSLGATRSVATFDQGTPPATPMQPRGLRVSRSGSGASVSWQPPSGSPRGLSFAIVAVPMAEGPLPARTCVTRARSCRVTGLERGVGYQVIVQARNAAGWGPAAAGWAPG